MYPFQVSSSATFHIRPTYCPRPKSAVSLMLGEQPDCCICDPNLCLTLELNINRLDAVTMVSIRAKGFGSGRACCAAYRPSPSEFRGNFLYRLEIRHHPALPKSPGPSDPFA
jgi:hypothetical protein